MYSHNRYFLNEVCTDIADLDYCEIRMLSGNYDDSTACAIVEERLRKENAKKENRIAELKDPSTASANASKARQATSRQKELENPVDEVFQVHAYQHISVSFERTAGDKVIETVEVAKPMNINCIMM